MPNQNANKPYTSELAFIKAYKNQIEAHIRKQTKQRQVKETDLLLFVLNDAELYAKFKAWKERKFNFEAL